MKPVALLAEGVDRNLIGLDVVLDPANVALLAEGVDRNFHGGKVELVCVSVSGSVRTIPAGNTK